MRAVDVGEVGAAGVAVVLLLKALLVTVAGGVVEEAPFSSTAASTARSTAAATLSSTVVASTVVAVLLPVPFPPVVPALLLVKVLRAIVHVVTVLTAVEALYPAGVTLRMHGNPDHRRLHHD